MLDAVVVGAGPSGCMAARDLARAGARVTILDGSHPREKPCGGGVTGRALSFGNTSTLISQGWTIRQVRFEAGGRAATVRVNDPDTLRIFDRGTFDTALLRDAINAGATHLRERVVRCDRVTDGWEVASNGRTIRAAWLLGADGACGITRKIIAQPFERTDISIASGSFVYGVEPTKPIDLVELAQQLDTLIENRSNLILRLSDAPELVRRLDSYLTGNRGNLHADSCRLFILDSWNDIVGDDKSASDLEGIVNSQEYLEQLKSCKESLLAATFATKAGPQARSDLVRIMQLHAFIQHMAQMDGTSHDVDSLEHAEDALVVIPPIVATSSSTLCRCSTASPEAKASATQCDT